MSLRRQNGYTQRVPICHGQGDGSDFHGDGHGDLVVLAFGAIFYGSAAVPTSGINEVPICRAQIA